ncbi:Histidine triad (HIT) protein [Sulfurimonas denitrificans DSM 1251]|uniref:Histidine triad (HIT) protein n=1 Tax=Sulfurimonas denitrificans (strain ATCC 33889 / DSM 1251) TaxID=326298 RepID=Q30RA0_SULDN|nr:HIT domain-containing protein [Sulfurimonas denitrificans]ABB44481.1 Histidine triad (HIT) protein [Sulfurimonas denitrificans DSM 1251]MDD3441663.1 HIT domain-containing protein [Sulfurimonas denitrificans]
MKDILYAPWRDEYINDKEIKGCVFCHISQHAGEDEELHVLYRDESCFIVMNRYPYTPGHFMIIPHLHTDKLELLPSEAWLHVSDLAQKCVRLLKEGFGADGVNIGMNLGIAGGAGIAEHIHMHLVPRWSRDTNFMTSIAQNRVYSTDFIRVYKKIKDLIPSYIS